MCTVLMSNKQRNKVFRVARPSSSACHEHDLQDSSQMLCHGPSRDSRGELLKVMWKDRVP